MTRPQQLLLDLPLKPNYSETDYVESPCNWEAAQWVRRWPDWPIKMVAIYGKPGCGKTHLAHIWRQKSGARLLVPADIAVLTPRDAVEASPFIIIDDADALFQNGNALAMEDWMFHFYNLIKEKGVDLLLFCLQPPAQWKVGLPDLRSRLATILSVAVNPPDEDALHAVLFKLCSERGMTLSPEAGAYILRRVERSFESMRRIVEILDRYTLSHRCPLTQGAVREALNEIGRG